MQTTIQEGNERLLKLAQHLETGKLGHEKFDFSVLNASLDEEGCVVSTDLVCGTLGCALGECPILFPESWRFGYEEPHTDVSDSVWESAEHFFALSAREAEHLFKPESQSEKCGGEWLEENATKEQVAANIRAFVALPHRQTK